MAIGGRPDIVSLAGGLPAAEFYPTAAIEAASKRALDRWGSAALEYGPIEGFPALREHIAARISKATGRTFTVANVLLTVGAMQGLDLLGKVLVDPGDLIVTQNPTYVGALDAWRPRRPRYVALDWSLREPDFGRALADAKFVYTVPNYSNPTGALVSTAARQALLERVVRAGTWLVEDDPYLPLQYDGDAGPSILALHGRMAPEGTYAGPVVYLGTLSKSIVPGLRVGWAIADPGMIQTLTLAKQSSDLTGSMLTQAIALELLEHGIEEQHVPGMVERYRVRRDALCAAASRQLGDWYEWEVPPGGMFVWMRARDPRIDTNDLYAFALEEKVAFVPSSVFDADGARRDAMRINFTRSRPEVIEEGIRRLARATERYLASL
ncbi:MAG: PLP-dependent aminotransferase family protein [Rhizobiaceae bacterium]|nr:PLP-dependent aminotransferase family protein [Rhizobiaceae bacterium]